MAPARGPKRNEDTAAPTKVGFMEPVYSPVIGVARAVFAAQGLKFTVTGAHNIPTTGGAVLIINHLSYLDFAYAGLAARPSRRLVRFMAKDDVFRHRVSGPLMRGMHHIPVDRTAGAASFRAAVGALKAGEIVGVFPEATISRSFELKGFKSGAVRMAQAAAVPVVPMIIWGSQRVWTKGYPKRLGRTNVPITLSVGEPILAGRREDADEVNAQIRACMIALLHQAQEAYPGLPSDELKFLPARLGGSAPTLEQATALDEQDAVRRAARRDATR
jgi:1-acyl-sn-glycerol-3-phosphate acyltransferase